MFLLQQYRFSAGPITKFSVRYNTPWVNDKYDSREVGKRLASVLLEYFDPMAMHNDHSDELLTFNDPKKVEALLPGMIHKYFQHQMVFRRISIFQH